MDLTSSSDEKLARDLSTIQPSIRTEVGENQEAIAAAFDELSVHRIELEMQNRALRDAQSELENAIRRYYDLYDNLPIAYVTLTSKGRIVEANATALQWFRRERARLVDSHINWFLDPFDAGRLAAHLESASSHNAAGSLIEVTLRLDDGLQMTVQLSSRAGSPLQNGERTVQTAITNITKLRQAHQVLDDISREQDSVTRSIAQDLREPVVAISDYARGLLQEHGGNLPSAAREAIGRMEGAAFRLEAALQNLLEYCQLREGEIALDPVSVEDVIQMVLLERRALIQQRHAEVQVERPLPCVRGSRLILGQVFSHLLKHAIDSAGPADLPRVQISAASEDRMITIKVAGESSLAPLDSERIFSLFEHTGNVNGGVCLAVIGRVVERMHGRVWIDAAARNSRCFYLQLPAI